MRIKYRHNMLSSRKRGVNLSLNAQLVHVAKELGLNVSHIAEAALEQAVRERQADAWLKDNADAITRYGEEVAERGVFSDGLRRF